jgi:hypothetical protein
MQFDVPLVPQTSTMSCWAASIAMVRGWRDQASYDPQLIARNFGGLDYTPSFVNGLDPNDRYILERNGFAFENPMCYTPQRVQSLLMQFGPLWVAGQVPAGPHIRVITGMNGDLLSINDPAPVNRGSQYTRTFSQFFGQMEDLGARELKQPNPVYVAYLRRASLVLSPG